MTADELLDLGPVIPVVTIEDADDAEPLARALLAGGLPTVEITLRTPAALAAIERIARELPQIAVGAGTVATPAQAHAARAAGARFLVSPGHTPRLLDAMASTELPFLAGCATPSEALALRERGIACAKLFPAAAIGGPAAAGALAGPFPELRLCATGGISPATAADYLAAPNVACVGGSWIAPPPLGDWQAITARAREAALLAATARR